jgi:type II secretory pathway pseudopilin PulG
MLLVVVAVIGMMAAIAIPNFVKFQERARAAAAQHQRLLQQHDLDEQESTPVPRR